MTMTKHQKRKKNTIFSRNFKSINKMASNINFKIPQLYKEANKREEN